MMNTTLKVFLALCFSSIFTLASWQISTVDSQGWVGTYTSIAIDSTGKPHISYYDDTQGTLKYARWDGSNWIISTVDSDDNTALGQYTSIALDNSDHAHISYFYDWYDNSQLRYAHWTGSTWQISIIDSSLGTLGTYTSIAIDNSQQPCIAYCDKNTGILKYAVRNGSNWTISTVDASGPDGNDTSLSLDNNGNPHISYSIFYGGYSRLKYAYRSGTTWQLTTLDPTVDGGDHNSIDVDNQNHAHISYNDYGNKHLKYIYSTGSSWIITTVDSTANVGYDSYIALNSLENPCISYSDDGNDTLKFARWNGMNWLIDTVDSTSNVGAYNCIAIDNNNNSHISYADYTYKDLKYACSTSDPGVNLTSFDTQSTPAAINLNWQVSPAGDTVIIGFNLYRKPKNHKTNEIWLKCNGNIITGENPYTYSDSNVKAGVEYEYKLTAITDDGEETQIGTIIGSSGSLATAFSLNSIKPNPASRFVKCSFTSPAQVETQIDIYDISGRKVKTLRASLNSGQCEYDLNITDLSTGVYVLCANANGNKANRRFVVSR
jgi:hypothetical protein